MAKRTKGKPSPAPVPAGRPRGRPKSSNPKGREPIAITIRGNPEWIAWLDGFIDALKKHSGLAFAMDRTVAIDLALARTAKDIGYTDPPARY
jgi:hypothetical protein